MTNNQELIDQFGRKHDYLRLSITEKCNLRCTYCMPAEGIQWSPKSHLMTADEIYQISKIFVDFGIKKIRLTGGEPLVRKDFTDIIKNLGKLPVSLALSTNGILLDQYFSDLEENGVKKLNISIDSLKEEKFNQITRRNYFEKVLENIFLAQAKGFEIKLNIVLIKGFNDDEILDFIALTKENSFKIRFIEFMPFDGNKWDKSKMITMEEILKETQKKHPKESLISLNNEPNDTSKNFRIKDYKGQFGIISTVSNPFCDSCNRIRITADGKIKNCLFSRIENDILSPLRQNKPIENILKDSIFNKKKIRNGMEVLEDFQNIETHKENRSMIKIGG